jgi:hypothetical protein
MMPTPELTDAEARREEIFNRLSSARLSLAAARYQATMDEAFLPAVEEREELVQLLERQLSACQ